MNDRELLEKAAKAVNGGGWHPLTHDTQGGRPWNPLGNDDDAFRLAITLEMSIVVSTEMVSARSSLQETWCDEYCDEDPSAATRRAIVRAAAAIGESHE